MGPRTCSLCGKDTHGMLDCPQLPIVRLGRAEAPIVGFRCWKARIANGRVRLTSIYKDAPWDAHRPMEAACDLRTKHAAPSLRQAAFLGFGEEVVFGAVLGWGRVFLHENGWRAQAAQVVCFTSIGLPREEDVAVAAAAGLPLVPSSAVETYAAEFGVDGAELYRRE